MIRKTTAWETRKKWYDWIFCTKRNEIATCHRRTFEIVRLIELRLTERKFIFQGESAQPVRNERSLAEIRPTICKKNAVTLRCAFYDGFITFLRLKVAFSKTQYKVPHVQMIKWGKSF